MPKRLALPLFPLILAAAVLFTSPPTGGAAYGPPPPVGAPAFVPVLPPYPGAPQPAAQPPAPSWTSRGERAPKPMLDSSPPCCPSPLVAPPNDNTSSATLISEPLPFTAGQSTMDATLEPGEPYACNFGSATVWFSFTPTVDETLTADTFGSDFDTVLQVYTPGGSPPGSLLPGPCNDDSGGLQSRIIVTASAGQTYLFQVGGFSGQTGNLVFHLDALPLPSCPPSPVFSFTSADPAGDAFGTFTPNHDIVSVDGAGDASSFCLTVGFAAHVDPADSPSINAVVGEIDIDTDQNADTGSSAFVDAFCPRASLTGADVYIDLFAVRGGLTYVAGQPVPVLFNDTSLTVVLPLALVGGDPNFNITMVVGSFYEPTDCAPADGGHIVSPTGAIVEPPPPPLNDNFANATLALAPLPFVDHQDTRGATREPGEAGACGAFVSTVWYRFVPTSDRILVADTFGSSFDTALSVYDDLGPPAGTPSLISCNNDAAGSPQSRVVFRGLPGVTYYFEVGGGGLGSRGDLTFHLAAAPDAGCPSGNDGFETGFVDSSLIPCWTVQNALGGSGSWCSQAGTSPPQGDCLGDEVTVPVPPQLSQAAMTNQSGPGASILYRCGYVSSPRVAFTLYINNAAGTFSTPPTLDVFSSGPNQQFRADLVSQPGLAARPFTVDPADVLLNLYQTRPGDPATSGYAVVTADASALLGEHACLRFAVADNLFFLHAGIDAVTVGLAAAPICGDVNRDGRVTLRDLILVSVHIGKRHYDTRYDVNHDGYVDSTDVLLVLNQLGRAC